MDAIDAALKSVEDSLNALKLRFRGPDTEVIQLFRAGITLDAMQADLEKARIDGTIPPGWGDAFVDGLNRAAMLIATVPRGGGEAFQHAILALGDVLSDVRRAHAPPHPI